VLHHLRRYVSRDGHDCGVAGLRLSQLRDCVVPKVMEAETRNGAAQLRYRRTAGSARADLAGDLQPLAMESIRHSSQLAAKQAGFREGLSLVVNCSLGRASFFVGEAVPAQWEVEVLPIHDVITMSSMENFSPIDLFRMAHSKDLLRLSRAPLFAERLC